MRTSLFAIRLLALSLTVLVAAPALAGPFGGWYDESSAASAKPAGLAFHQELYNEYRKLSKDRASAMGDGADAELFNHKALLASTRTAVQQDSVDDRKLTDEQRMDFAKQSDRLTRLFERGGRELAPTESATAQVSYDCWIEATEAKRKKDIDACKNKFLSAMQAAEEKADRGMGVQPAPAPVPVAAPAPAVIPPQWYYQVQFEFNSTRPNAEGRRVLEQAIKDIKTVPTLKIALRAHADRSGEEPYNATLSRQRAELVLNTLAAAGIPAQNLRLVEAVGETRSLVPTPDGVKNQGNRVVEIDLRQ